MKEKRAVDRIEEILDMSNFVWAARPVSADAHKVKNVEVVFMGEYMGKIEEFDMHSTAPDPHFCWAVYQNETPGFAAIKTQISHGRVGTREEAREIVENEINILKRPRSA